MINKRILLMWDVVTKVNIYKILFTDRTTMTQFVHV
jgi:hypothetical protein